MKRSNVHNLRGREGEQEKPEASDEGTSSDEMPLPKTRKAIHDKADAQRVRKVEVIDPESFSSLGGETSVKPGKKYPSETTSEKVYRKCANAGVALIFNQVKFKQDSNEGKREGSEKDANDLSGVLKSFGFDVKLHVDLTVEGIRKILLESKSQNLNVTTKIQFFIISSIGTRSF